MGQGRLRRLRRLAQPVRQLQSDEGREELLFKLRNKAAQQLPASAQAATVIQPLAALALLTAEEQREKFRLLLQRAMPVLLSLTGGFGICGSTNTRILSASRTPLSSSACTARCCSRSCRRAPGWSLTSCSSSNPAPPASWSATSS